jgi:hypothetical protein
LKDVLKQRYQEEHPMRQIHEWTRMMMVVAGAFALVFATACGTTTTTQATVVETTASSEVTGAGRTADPLGPPGQIDSRPIGVEHPSSATGAGNMKGSGTNTNLNRPVVTQADVTVTQTDVVVTETPIVEGRVVSVEEPVIVEERTEVRTVQVEPRTETRVVTEEVTTTRRITQKQ